MQVESSTKIYVSKENVTSYARSRKLVAKATKREFGQELVNIEHTPAIEDPSTAEADSLPISPFKALFAQDTADRESVFVYTSHVLDHLKNRQANYFLNKDFLAAQNEITGKMRSILVDWLVDVSGKFRLAPQTLFQTVNTIDRYLSIQQISKTELQLLGATCLMLQSKYEEVYPPQIKTFMAVCDNAYSADQMLDMEANVLTTLGFDLSQASVLYWLQIAQLELKLDAKPLAFARYVLETSLLDVAIAKYNNSTIVAGAVFLVQKIFKVSGWTNDLNDLFGVTEAEVRACGKDLYLAVQRADASSLSAIKRKFATAEYCEVSKFKIERGNTNKQ